MAKNLYFRLAHIFANSSAFLEVERERGADLETSARQSEQNLRISQRRPVQDGSQEQRLSLMQRPPW